MLKLVTYYHFLENKIEYKIFKIVKIATAIKKLTVQLIWYIISGNNKKLLITFSSNHKIVKFIKKLIIGKIKNNGNQIIFNIGFIKIFKNHKITHQNIYVCHPFQAPLTITASGCVGVFKIKAIKNKILAFSKIEKIIFIIFF